MAAPARSPSAPPPSPPPVAAAAASPARPAVLRPVALAALLGLAEGGLLYGGAISLLHVIHNPGAGLGPGDALVLLVWCLALYGALGAVAAGATMLVLRGLRWLAAARGGTARAVTAEGSRSPAAVLSPAGAAAGLAADRSLLTDLWLATSAFHATFWFLATSYGLTYDQSPSWVRVAWQMLLWLVVRALVTVAVVAPLAWIVTRGALAVLGRRRGWAHAGGLVAALALAHVIPTLLPPAERAAPPVPPRSLLDAGGLKVAVVAVDGADWRVILPLVRAGRMPNLQRLMAEGSWGPLASFRDSNSAVIWASIYSGRRPGAHGVLDFYTLRLAGMGRDLVGLYPVHRTFLKEAALRLQRHGAAELTPIDRSRVAVPLLWEVAQARGRTIGVVDGYFYSYPAPALASDRSWFLSYGSDGLWQDAARAGHRPSAADAGHYAAPAGLVAELGPILGRADFDWQAAGLQQLLARRGQPDLVSLYSHQPDAVQHEAWRYYEPARFFGIDPVVAARRDRIVPFHLALDAFLGRLEKQLEPGTVLVLVSDHGHSPTLFHSMDTQHRHGPPGILLLHGGPVRPGTLAGAGVLDVFPTVLYLLGLPLPEDGDGRLLEQALAPEFLRAHPARRVPSWAGLPTPAPAVPLDPARRAEELEKLRSLGYLR